MRRIADTIKEVVDRFRGVKDPQLDAMRRVEKYMRKALDQVERRRRSEYREARVKGYADKISNLKDLQFAADSRTDRDEKYRQAVLGRDWRTAQKVLEEEMAENSIEWPFTAYRNASDALMGFTADGRSQKGYGEHEGYKARVTVDIRFDGDTEPYIDNMDGLNVPHAMERARRNWPDAREIRFVSGTEEETYLFDADDNLVLPSNRFGWRKNYKEAKSGKNKYGIDWYSDEEYNQFGWVRASGIMSASEWDNFNHRLSDFDYNSYSEHTTPDGRVVVSTRDDDNRLGLVTIFRGGYQSPEIERVFRLNWDMAPNEVETVVKEIERYEHGWGKEAYEAIAAYIEDGAVEVFGAEDYRRSEQVSWESSGANGEDGRNDRPSGVLRDGGRRYQETGRDGTESIDDLQYAVPEDDLIDQQIDAWIDSSTALEPRTQLTAVFDDCMCNGFDI